LFSAAKINQKNRVFWSYENYEKNYENYEKMGIKKPLIITISGYP